MNVGSPQIGPYKIIRALGGGTSSKVKLAINCETEKLTAIKIIKKSVFSANPKLHQKIQREIALMRLIDHPHLLKLIDVLDSPNHLYLALEYCSNGELFQEIVKRGHFDEQTAMYFFRQIIYGVEYIHSLGICHRDLKPENILIDQNNSIRIADFGFARYLSEDLATTSCGSPHYAAPEIIKGIPYDGRKSDIWSCGVILYALLAGFLPFDDPNIRGLLNKVKSGSFQFPSTFSEASKDLIRHIICVDQNARYTIKQIKEHSYFKGFVDPNYVFPSPIPITNINDPYDPNELDESMVKTISKICFQAIDEIMHELTSDTFSMIKVFYSILTRKLYMDRLDWSQSYNGADMGVETEILSQFMNQSFVSPVQSFARSPQSITEGYSYARKADWFLEDGGEQNIQSTEFISNDDLISVMVTIQEVLGMKRMQWFYPDDFNILCRTPDEEPTYIIITASPSEEDTETKVALYLVMGDANVFIEFADVVNNALTFEN